VQAEREREVSEMVGRKLHLPPAGGQLEITQTLHPGVVHQ
jgi:hypothetical protein